MSTQHLRPRYTTHKMTVDDSSQKIGRNMYLQGPVCTTLTGKCIEECKILQQSHLYKTTTLSSRCFLIYPNNFMFFLIRQTLGRQTMTNHLRNADPFRINLLQIVRMRRYSSDRNLTSSRRRLKSRLRLRQPFFFFFFYLSCNDKLFMKRHWHNLTIVRLIFAQKVIAKQCRTAFVFDVPVWRAKVVSNVGLWTCRCVDLSACRPVGLSICCCVDLSVCRLSACRSICMSTCRCVDLSAIEMSAKDLLVYLLTILFGW